MSAIDISDVTVTFPDGTVGLDDIDLHVHPEEFIALIGPSGSGKTTLLRTIAGFLSPSAGRLAIGGRELTHVPPEQRRLGMVFQQHAVWPHMNVAANVAYPLKRAGVDKRERRRRVDHALSLVGLDGYGARKPASLSGGQRQRVALARAIVAEPRVLLLDEALSALDEPLRDSLRRELVALTRREGLTTVHVTHDRAEALAVADRVVVLMGGRIHQIAEPHELLSRPATAEVAAFIADATVLTARRDHVGVHCPALDASWPPADVEFIGAAPTGTAGEVGLAVLPSAVEVLVADSPGTVDARVSSALFSDGDYSVTLETGSGHRFRARMRGVRPEIDERVGLRINRVLAYPG